MRCGTILFILALVTPGCYLFDGGAGSPNVEEEVWPDVLSDTGYDGDSLIERRTPIRHHVVVSVTLTRTGPDLETAYLFFIKPQTDPYQDVADYTYDPEHARVVAAETGPDEILVYTLAGEALPAEGEARTWSVAFNLTTYSIVAHPEVITEFYPYDETSEIYTAYTGQYPDLGRETEPWIDPTHPEVVVAADELWAASTDPVDFAERVFYWTAERLEYFWDPVGGNPRTLAEILEGGKGSCGSYALLVMSLLRAKGIPCRHLYGAGLQDGSFHGWAEAYFEGWGWIPVDATQAEFTDLPFGSMGQGPGSAPISTHGDLILVDGMPLLGLQLSGGFSFQPDYEVRLSVQSEELQ